MLRFLTRGRLSDTCADWLDVIGWAG